MARGIATLTVSALLVLTACGSADGPAQQGATMTSDVQFHQIAVADAAAATDVVNASDAFGLDVLASAAGDPQQNLVFSPASAFVALAMLAEGATNAAATELNDLLGSTGDARSQAINALAGILARYEGEPASLDNEDLPDSPLLHLANNVVLDDQANPQQGFLDRLVRYYNAGVRVTDLASAQGGRVLDAWVREHTGGRIKESAIEPDPDLYLVLQDAILLAARWQQEFDPNDTGKGPFTSSTGSVQTVDLMHGQFDLKYAEADGWIAIEMPYQEGFTARIVLPPEGADPAAIGATRLAALNRAIDAAPATSVSVVLPRFVTRSRVELNQVLQVHGLAAIFDPGSRSFEAISTDVPLFVGQAVQQASITVGEQGTVAAAVTEIGMMAGSMPIKPDHEFVADRPFLMVVQEATTGWDLIQTVIHSID